MVGVVRSVTSWVFAFEHTVLLILLAQEVIDSAKSCKTKMNDITMKHHRSTLTGYDDDDDDDDDSHESYLQIYNAALANVKKQRSKSSSSIFRRCESAPSCFDYPEPIKQTDNLSTSTASSDISTKQHQSSSGPNRHDNNDEEGIDGVMNTTTPAFALFRSTTGAPKKGLGVLIQRTWKLVRAKKASEEFMYRYEPREAC